MKTGKDAGIGIFKVEISLKIKEKKGAAGYLT